MNEFLSRIKVNTRLYDRQRAKERIVQTIETQPSVVFLTLRDAKTGDVERRAYVIADLSKRFDILDGEGIVYRGDACLVRLVAEAHRLNHAYLFNPVFATETSLIDPLPHQLVAVYGIPPDADHPDGLDGLVSYPRLRFLLADDAGAGKTIMAGLYVREMLLRRLVRRILVIPPAGLVGNWERELRNLFRLRFRIVDSGDVRPDNNPFADSRFDCTILSIDTARQDRVRAALNDAPAYDLVICDEAHKLSARRNPDLSVERSKRYETVEEIAARCQHLLLLSATPHMGKDDPYFFLWRLLDPQQFSTPDALYRTRPEVRRRHLLRRMKEEMVRFDGAPLYPPRESKTVSYPLNADERMLYEAVSQYVEEYYRKTTAGNRSSVGLALSVIQRRLASSAWALLRSVERRAAILADKLKQLQDLMLTEEQFALEQGSLPTKDLREEKTGDEEESEDGIEEGERFDDTVSRATTARNPAELAQELQDVQALAVLARAVYDTQQESKFLRLQELLSEHPDTKILIFTEHRDTLNFLVARMEGMGYTDRIATIHGSMDYRERERQAARFRSPECPYMIATDAAGEGINLQFCWLLINFDIPWNPARLEQRMGRVHRYKQTHDVLLLSLVAENTREGAVLKTLLDKIEIIRQRLGNDKVFDVIGEQLGGISLSDLLFQAAIQGEEAASTAAVAQAFDPVTFAEKLKVQESRVEVSEVRALLQTLRRGQETAEERRMMPAYVRGFFRDVTPLLGLQYVGDLEGEFTLTDAPETIQRAVETYPPELHSRLTFDRYLAMPPTAVNPQAIYLHPGEAVFESLMDLFLGRFENETERGATFYDTNAVEAYMFALAKIAVVRPVLDGDGQPTDARETLGEEMMGVILRPDGSMQSVPAHLLLTLDIEGVPGGAVKPPTVPDLLAEVVDNPALIEGFVMEEKGIPLLERLQSELQARLPQRKNQLVQSYNLRASEAMNQRRRLKDDVTKGVPAAKSKLDRLEKELSGLDDARDMAVSALHQEIDLLDFGPVTIYARALVVPLPPEEAARRRDVQAEDVALRVVRQHEETQGAWIEDVSNPNLATGYDLRSHRQDGSVLYIEVKGRAGVAPVQLTENEWRQAANHRDKYWLYTVYHCDTATPQLHRIADPFGTLVAKDGGVVITAGSILGAAE
ncbi:MAG: helicase protein [Chthonomonadaceae bacterium]|nr:helicase protein [Chthonomonadaceae bacterium]